MSATVTRSRKLQTWTNAFINGLKNIIYCTLIEVNGDLSKKKLLEEIILIKVPTEIYPEIRNLFIFLFKKSGFDKIKIEENINFRLLHEKRTVQ